MARKKGKKKKKRPLRKQSIEVREEMEHDTTAVDSAGEKLDGEEPANRLIPLFKGKVKKKKGVGVKKKKIGKARRASKAESESSLPPVDVETQSEVQSSEGSNQKLASQSSRKKQKTDTRLPLVSKLTSICRFCSSKARYYKGLYICKKCLSSFEKILLSSKTIICPNQGECPSGSTCSFCFSEAIYSQGVKATDLKKFERIPSDERYDIPNESLEMLPLNAEELIFCDFLNKTAVAILNWLWNQGDLLKITPSDRMTLLRQNLGRARIIWLALDSAPRHNILKSTDGYLGIRNFTSHIIYKAIADITEMAAHLSSLSLTPQQNYFVKLLSVFQIVSLHPDWEKASMEEAPPSLTGYSEERIRLCYYLNRKCIQALMDMEIWMRHHFSSSDRRTLLRTNVIPLMIVSLCSNLKPLFIDIDNEEDKFIKSFWWELKGIERLVKDEILNYLKLFEIQTMFLTQNCHLEDTKQKILNNCSKASLLDDISKKVKKKFSSKAEQSEEMQRVKTSFDSMVQGVERVSKILTSSWKELPLFINARLWATET